jgi:hypothetical protein
MSAKKSASALKIRKLKPIRSGSFKAVFGVFLRFSFTLRAVRQSFSVF